MSSTLILCVGFVYLMVGVVGYALANVGLAWNAR